jgi:tRNA-specific 2-thiouridylase
MSKKVAVAMSGGVDSGVAAALLVKKGYEVTGFHLRFWKEKVKDFENKCCDIKSLEAARKTAWKLGIPFYVVDFAEIFKKKVVDYFLKEYASGRTPNPCVMCNKYIKFGEFLRYVRGLGFNYLATGHYSRIVTEIPNSKFQISNKLKIYHLLEAKDKSKDQSYFLYNLTQQQLAHILLPVGEYTKRQVREMAKKWGLAVAERPESQEICFFPESDYRPFLKRQIPEKIASGEVVDTHGRVIGRHFGLPLYTIGQRHGFEINVKYQMSNVKNTPPFYVIGKNVKKNRLIVGFGKETEQKEFWVEKANWILPNIKPQTSSLKFFVRIRHQGELLKCKIPNSKSQIKNKLKIILVHPYRGIAPGQVAVFYKPFVDSHTKKTGYEVLGGGIII